MARCFRKGKCRLSPLGRCNGPNIVGSFFCKSKIDKGPRLHLFFNPANRDCSGSRHFDQCLAFSFSLTMTSCCTVIYFKSSIF